MPRAIHPLADVLSKAVGDGTRVWQYAVVLPGAVIGANCNICAQVFIENDVVIGDNVTIKNGVQIWDGLRIESDAFIGPNVTFTNDAFPRAGHRPEEFAKTTIRRGASIGANATILPGLVVGENAMVGAGSVVTRSVPPNAIVSGNPATVVGYTDAQGRVDPDIHPLDPTRSGSIEPTAIGGAVIHHLPVTNDIRGSATMAEFDGRVPFRPLRYYIVFDVPSRETRGEHALRTCHQFLTCVKGSCAVVVDDGERRVEVNLNSATKGLYVAPMTWTTQYKFSGDALLLVLASAHYDQDDYIRDHAEFRRAVEILRGGGNR